MESKLILITGVTGYVGAHVLQQALGAGYRVRVTARPEKVADLKAKYHEKVDVVGIADITKGDYTSALKDVYAVLHIAAPLPGKADPAGMLDGAVGGALNLLHQAAKQGVRRIVVTSTILSVLDMDRVHQRLYANSDKPIKETEWNPATKEQLLEREHHPVWVYSAAKTIAEQEAWKFAEAHPEIDVTTVNPPYIYGPVADGVKIYKGQTAGLSTAGMFYGNVLPSNGSTVIHTVPQAIDPQNIDVRDVARAHILALEAPLEKDVGRHKRLLIASPSFTWKQAIEHIAVVRPELVGSGRLPDTSKLRDMEIAKVDVSFAEKVLGFGEYIDWQKTVEDSVDSLLAMEKEWGSQA